MLYEFALDPGVLSSWQSFRYLIEKFGVPHGRMISRFPKKWKRMVYEACVRCPDVERKKIEEGLTRVDAKLLPTNRGYDGNMPWLKNAETQHRSQPFHAIISDSNPRSVSEVLIADELNDTTRLWNVEREAIVPRKAEAIAQIVRPLLQACSEVLFIDPYFDPGTTRYRRTLEHFALAMHGNMRIRRVEYHLSDKIDKAHFDRTCQDVLPRLLPKGIEITLIRWEQIEGGEDLHPRYILTDIGGVRVEHGLDQGEEGETADISLLDYTLYAQRWKDFQRETPAYKYLDEVRVLGKREVT